MSRRINFAPPPKRRQFAAASLWQRGEGIDALEGPHVDHGIPTRFHWCSAPESRASLTPEGPGRYLIIIEYQNPWLVGQEVAIRLGEANLGTYSLVRTSRESSRLLCLRAPLSAGPQELRLSFTRWIEPQGTEPRRLALMLNDIHLERISRPG